MYVLHLLSVLHPLSALHPVARYTPWRATPADLLESELGSPVDDALVLGSALGRGDVDLEVVLAPSIVGKCTFHSSASHTHGK